MTPTPVFPDSTLVHHRGFDIRLQAEGSRFAFEVTHRTHTLHTSTYAYRSGVSAERAARQFVDDALRVFDAAIQPIAV
ncbi:MAG: hypothetical protein AAGK21_09880 [Bacteroidota bacterium]